MRANTPDPACMLIVVGGRQVAASKESQQCVLESTLGNSIDKRVGKRSRSVAQRYLSRPIANCGCTTLSCNNLTSSQPTCQKSYVRFVWLQDIYATAVVANPNCRARSNPDARPPKAFHILKLSICDKQASLLTYT